MDLGNAIDRVCICDEILDELKDVIVKARYGNEFAYGDIELQNSCGRALWSKPYTLEKHQTDTELLQLHTSTRMGHLEVEKPVLYKDPSISFRIDKKGQNALHTAKRRLCSVAAEARRPNQFIMIRISMNQFVNMSNISSVLITLWCWRLRSWTRKPCQKCSRKCAKGEEKVKKLGVTMHQLENPQSACGSLHTATRMGHLEVAKPVLYKDPRINFRIDKKGQNALHTVVSHSFISFTPTYDLAKMRLRFVAAEARRPNLFTVIRISMNQLVNMLNISLVLITLWCWRLRSWTRKPYKKCSRGRDKEAEKVKKLGVTMHQLENPRSACGSVIGCNADAQVHVVRHMPYKGLPPFKLGQKEDSVNGAHKSHVIDGLKDPPPK
ncbi:anamorsin [Tanacetum coccineum]